jgi:hypothetical protein
LVVPTVNSGSGHMEDNNGKVQQVLQHNPYLLDGLDLDLKLLTTIQTVKSLDSSCVSHILAVYLCIEIIRKKFDD